MATILTAPTDDFVNMWIGTFNQRMVGELHSPDGNIEYICQKLGVPLDNDRIKRASKLRFDFGISTMIPRADAISTVSSLKTMDYKTCLVSNCSSEAPVIWNTTEFAPLFDATVFSCLEKVMKPDLRIYELALTRLDMRAKDCLYVGDGGNKELSGASQAGMHPVLLKIPPGDGDAYQVDMDPWDGPAISSLSEVLELVR